MILAKYNEEYGNKTAENEIISIWCDFDCRCFISAALERLTGINQGLLSHYATGMKKPLPAQKKKIEDALHNLGAELLAVEL